MTFSALLSDSIYYIDANECFCWRHIEETNTLETEISFLFLNHFLQKNAPKTCFEKKRQASDSFTVFFKCAPCTIFSAHQSHFWLPVLSTA